MGEFSIMGSGEKKARLLAKPASRVLWYNLEGTEGPHDCGEHELIMRPWES